MKFFVALVALVGVAVASPARFLHDGQLSAILEAIQSPLTDPATAALLEQQLQELLAVDPIVVGPGVIEFPELPPSPEPIVIPPPVVDPPTVITPPIVNPPVVVLPPVPEPIPQPAPEAQPEASSAPLVQLILNINQA
ncbi:uncharacterized protein LOC131852938 [Achroia grisella]|uniref:uncharacterized protein LOC131852938 n=1 Tax=Achroia grisella TaxID=688607 RepID=UPI0027D2FDA9|nr:uncharacterized protein LOC131852938 [Achroia grisella]